MYNKLFLLLLCFPTLLTTKVANLYRKHLSNLAHMLDDQIAPCDDFFQHACGSFGAPSSSEESEEPLPPFLYNNEDRMHFFEESRQHFGTRTGEMLRDLYDDCKERGRYDVIRGIRPSHWQRILMEVEFLAKHAQAYKRWPFLYHQWEKMQLDERVDLNWVTLAAELAAHGISSFLEIFFAEGTIFIAPVFDHKCRSLAVITESLRPVLQRRNPQIADIIANELCTFCRELMGELPTSGEVYSYVVENSAGETDLLIDEIIATYFQTYFSKLNFTEMEIEEARKLPIDTRRLGEILNVVRKTEPRILVNFLLWNVYDQLKYDDCFLLTEEFEYFVLAEYWQWHVFEERYSRDVAMASWLFHTTRFQKRRKSILGSDDWAKFLEVKMQRKDFNIERLVKNYANTFLDPQNLTDAYAALPLLPNGSFYGNLLNMRRLKLRNSYFMPLIDEEDFNHPAYFLRQFLHFSISMLKQPLYHYFATQGFDLWHDSNLLYSTDDFYTSLDCLERQSQLHLDDSPIFTWLTESEIERIFRFYRAFIESYRDYRFWLKSESFAFAEDFVLEYFKMDSQKIMFYAMSQMYCGRNDAVYGPLINRSFMNVPEFSEAFNCSTEAPMNPIVKCMISQCD